MIKKANINWTAKQLAKMIDKGTINFDNSVQRGFVWDNARKSLLIHSMIEGYPIPAFYAAKNDNGYDMLDGKQRSSSIKQFLANDFALSDLPEITLEDNTQLDISGLTYDELSEDIQDTISGYSLTVYYFDGITDDEIAELFFRLNNGKPLTAIELTRVKAKSIETIKEIGKHEIFTAAISEKAINKYTNEDITIKAWAVLNVENVSFETKQIRPLMADAEITPEQAEAVKTAFTRVQAAYNTITAKEGTADETKLYKKIAKRVFTRTHLISVVPMALKSVNSGVSVEAFAEWLIHFYSGKKSASINEEYNNNASSGSARAEAITARLTALQADYNRYFQVKEDITAA